MESGNKKMKMQMSDKAKLDAEGVVYHRHTTQYPYHAGWYLKEKFIGYNYKEALDWLWKNGY